MTRAVAAVVGCLVLALAHWWLRRSEADGRRPLLTLLPVLGMLIAFLFAGVGTGLIGGSGIEHPVVLDVVVIGISLTIGAAVGAFFARDWYKRKGT